MNHENASNKYFLQMFMVIRNKEGKQYRWISLILKKILEIICKEKEPDRDEVVN